MDRSKTFRERLQIPSEGGLPARAGLQTRSLKKHRDGFQPSHRYQNENRAPNSLHSDRGIIVLLGAMNPIGCSNVDGSAILFPKSFP